MFNLHGAGEIGDTDPLQCMNFY